MTDRERKDYIAYARPRIKFLEQRVQSLETDLSLLQKENEQLRKQLLEATLDMIAESDCDAYNLD